MGTQMGTLMDAGTALLRVGETGGAAAGLLALVAAAGLAMARPLGAAIVLPVFTRAQIGGPVRGCFAFALSLPAVPGAARTLGDAAPDAARLLLLGAKEAFAGVLLGVLVGLPIWAVQCAGEILDTQRSATSAQTPEPGTGNQGSTTGEFLGLTAVTLFVAAGGLGGLADSLYASYGVWPLPRVLPEVAGGGWADFALGLLGHVSRVSLLLAAPVAVAMLAAEAGVILLMRAVPRLNPYDLAPTLRNLVFAGFVVLYAQYLLAYAGDELDTARRAADALRALLR